MTMRTAPAARIAWGTLAGVFALAGAAKLARTRDQLAPHMSWVEHATDGQVKMIGSLEGAGAVGLILPHALDVAPVLTPLAAAGLALTMVGAAITHVRIGEPERVPINLVLFAAAAFVAAERF
jgi:hypothetical protein